MADPRLQAAMSEILGVFKKYDIGGHVTLVSKTHAQYAFVFDPSWSAIKPRGDVGVRLRATAEDFGGDKAARNKAIELSAHLLFQVRDMSLQSARQCQSLIEPLQAIVPIDHESYAGHEVLPRLQPLAPITDDPPEVS